MSAPTNILAEEFSDVIAAMGLFLRDQMKYWVSLTRWVTSKDI